MAKRKQPKAIEIIELSSDSEGDDVPQPSPPNPVAEEAPQTAEEEDHPLLRIEGIRYNTEPEEEEPPKPTQTDAPAPAKLPVRAKNTPGKDTGSARHRHVSIEIALPTSSLRATKGKAPATEIPDSEEEKDEASIYKTPNDRRKHITFDDSDNDEYLTPMEHPGTNALELAPPKATDGVKADLDAVEEEQEDEEDSDDEAPEAVSSHAAGAQQAKSSQAAMNAAKQYVHHHLNPQHNSKANPPQTSRRAKTQAPRARRLSQATSRREEEAKGGQTRDRSHPRLRRGTTRRRLAAIQIHPLPREAQARDPQAAPPGPPRLGR